MSLTIRFIYGGNEPTKEKSSLMQPTFKGIPFNNYLLKRFSFGMWTCCSKLTAFILLIINYSAFTLEEMKKVSFQMFRIRIIQHSLIYKPGSLSSRNRYINMKGEVFVHHFLWFRWGIKTECHIFLHLVLFCQHLLSRIKSTFSHIFQFDRINHPNKFSSQNWKA